LIDVEAHYLDRPFLELLRGRSEPPREEVDGDEVRIYPEPSAPDVFQGRNARLEGALLDVGEARLAVMDADGVDVQLLSLNLPGCEQLEPAAGAAAARERNDLLAGLVAAHPSRFAALAALCPDPESPETAADELERCVRDLGFRGCKLNSHVRAGYLDDERFLPIFERAASLGAPIFLHPTVPHGAMVGPYRGYGHMLPGPALGFAAETALQVVRLVLSGLFDRLPQLQIVLGHLGEGLPFWLYRLDYEFTKPWIARDPRCRCEHPPSHYIRANTWAATSGHLQASAFAATHAELGAGRMLFASDYPYESAGETAAFVRAQLADDAEREQVLHGNAAALFGIA
jgi:predicted TIM-barrel fold metal-dependent hydrolase